MWIEKMIEAFSFSVGRVAVVKIRPK